MWGAGATLAFSLGRAVDRGAAGPDSGAHQHSGCCGGNRWWGHPGEQVTALVWMDDSWTKVITMEGASEKWAGLG